MLAVIPRASAAPWPSIVQGFGFNDLKAREHAIDQAAREIAKYLEELSPPIKEWKPDRDFVKQHLLVDLGFGSPDIPDPNGESLKVWNVRLKSPDRAQFEGLNRQALTARWERERTELSQDRLILSGWVFAGILGLLTVMLASSHIFGRLKTN